MLSLAVMFLSGFFHGIAGFGFPMIATPLLSLMGSVQSAVLATLLPTMAVNFFTIKTMRNGFSVVQRFWLLAVCIIIGSWSGTQLLVLNPTEIYKLLLAAVIILYLIREKLHLTLGDSVQRFFWPMMVFFGLLSGIVSGLVNVMIPILIIYVLELKLEKNISIALMNFCFLSSKVTQVITFSTLGVFGKDELLLAVPAVGVALIALHLGKRFHEKISASLYKKILTLSLWFMAIMLIGQFLL